MNKLQIKNETFPIRCEICHQSDKLDLVKGSCERCNQINPSLINPSIIQGARLEINYKLNKQDLFYFNIYNYFRKTSTWIMVTILGGIFFYSAIRLISTIIAPIIVKLIILLIVAIFWLSVWIIPVLIILALSIGSKKNKTVLTDYKLFISDKHVIEESEFRRDQHNWKGVQSIISNKYHIYIFVSETTAIIIPKRFFVDFNEEQLLMGLINKFWKNTTK
jgi:hypothetical protein